MDNPVTLSFEMREYITGGEYDPYEGPYEVVPTKNVQTLKTNKRRMKDDVTVDAINYSETLNIGGGKTAVIGYE